MELRETFRKIKSSFSSFFDRDKSKYAIEPYRGWVTVFSLGVLLCLIFAGVGGYLFWEINKGDIFVVGEPSSSLPAINRSMLEGVVAENKERAQKLEGLMQVRPQIVDPSL